MKEKFDIVMTIRVRESDKVRALELVEKYPDKYMSVSHIIRCGIQRLWRLEQENKEGENGNKY